MDPFKRPGDRMVAIANVAVPVLVDRAGGSVTITTEEFDELRSRFGGAVGVKAVEIEPGTYRLELTSIDSRPEPLLD